MSTQQVKDNSSKREKENIWNSILSEAGTKKKFQNKQLLVVGAKNAGKRTLIDSLHGPSSTHYPKVKLNEMHSGNLRVAGSASALDYVYLNVKNIDDSDEDTFAKLGVYIMEDDSHKDLLPLILKRKSVEDTTLIIVLDLAEPWLIIEQLEKWIDVIVKHLELLELSLATLDEMRSKVERRVRDYKEFVSKKIDSMHSPDEEEVEHKLIKDSIPLAEGVLTSNLGIPIVVVANKADVLPDVGDYAQIQSIILSLRKFCLSYGAGLVFTSSKSKDNLDILYDYILHIAYNFKLKHKSETNNIEPIFVPAGLDNLNLIRLSNPEFDISKSYQELVRKPTSKVSRKDEDMCEDEQEFLKSLHAEKDVEPNATLPFFSKFLPATITSTDPSQILRNSASLITSVNTNASAGSTGNKKNTNVASFYKDLLNKPNANKTMRQNAEKDLEQKIESSTSSSSSAFRNEEIEQVKQLIKKKKN